MAALEPNWISLLWFAGFATIGAVGFLIVVGMLPLKSRPDAAKSNAATVLVIGNSVLLAMLLVSTGLYGYAELKWSTLIVATGLIVLFAPGLFEAWPSRLRDGLTGLVALGGVQILALAALAKVAGPIFATAS
jgi:predicted permease